MCTATFIFQKKMDYTEKIERNAGNLHYSCHLLFSMPLVMHPFDNRINTIENKIQPKHYMNQFMNFDYG